MFKRCFRFGGLLLMSLTILIATSCDDDCPVCPGDDEVISDYDIIISSPEFLSRVV